MNAFQNIRFGLARRGLAGAAALAVLASTSVAAQEALVFGNPDYFCRNGAFPGGGEYAGEHPVFKRARVTARKGGAQVHFLKDYAANESQPGCPSSENAQCLGNSYLVPGDEVILSKTLRGFACAWYQPRHGHETVGWLPLSDIEVIEPDQHPPIKAWIGTWKYWDDTLTLQRDADGESLRVKGRAYWPARNLPPFHSGEVTGSARPERNLLVLENKDAPAEFRCQVRLSLVGPLLVVSDNRKCGGANVSFDGVYVRQGR